MVVLWLILTYFSTSVLYLLLLSISGSIKSDRSILTSHPNPFNKQLILIPAYREDAVICATVQNVLSQHYPKSLFDVLVIADSLRPNTLKRLKSMPVKTLEVTFDKSTKAKSLNAAFNSIPEDINYDIVSIIDADNFLEKDYLQKVNFTYNKGYKAIQCRRVAKNINNQISVLDALSEIINNHIYRKGAQNLGLSSSLIGSGMAFEYTMAQTLLKQVDAIGGFDRVLQMLIVDGGVKIFYLEDAKVFDEKVEKGAQFENQRKRWIASQYYYLKQFSFLAIRKLFKGDIDYFHLGFVQNFFLPKYLNLGALLLTTVFVAIFYFNSFFTHFLLLLTLLHIVAFLIPVPRRFYNKRFAKAVLYLPITFFYMLRSFFQMKGANDKFIHTEHTKVEIDQDLYENG